MSTQDYVSAQGNADYLLQAARSAGIRDTKELANFMGQMQVESGDFRQMHENLHYSAEGLLNTFPGRNGLETLEQAKAIVKGGPEAVANAIYGGDWGKSTQTLGNTEPGDGWRYHGRGYVQLTGRDRYTEYGEALGLDLVHHPELAADREAAAEIAVKYWKSQVVAYGDQRDVTAACKDINGRDNGLEQRKAAAAAWEEKLEHGYEPHAVRETSIPSMQHVYTPAQRRGDDAAVSGQAFATGDADLDRLAVALFANDDKAISQASLHIQQSPEMLAMAQQGRDLLAVQQAEALRQQQYTQQMQGPVLAI